MLNCKARLAQKNSYPPQELNAIEAMAQEIITSCEQHPIPRPDPSSPASEFIYWIGYDGYLRAEVRGVASDHPIEDLLSCGSGIHDSSFGASNESGEGRKGGRWARLYGSHQSPTRS